MMVSMYAYVTCMHMEICLRVCARVRCDGCYLGIVSAKNLSMAEEWYTHIDITQCVRVYGNAYVWNDSDYIYLRSQ